MKSGEVSFHSRYAGAMFNFLRRIPTPPAPPAPPSILEVRAALARLDADKAKVDAALRRAFDRRRAALLCGDDADVDGAEAEIDSLGREQERAEVIERELLNREAAISETTS